MIGGTRSSRGPTADVSRTKGFATGAWAVAGSEGLGFISVTLVDRMGGFANKVIVGDFRGAGTGTEDTSDVELAHEEERGWISVLGG